MTSANDLEDERRVLRFLAKHPGSSAERVIVETGAMPSLLLAMLNAQRLAGGARALTLPKAHHLRDEHGDDE